MVIWLIGISGAGKTTLGNKLKAFLDDKGIKSFVIDGDLVREFFDNDLGYTAADRRANIKRILLAAHMLDEYGAIAIVCNIHPFEELRALARKKIRNYNEIYLHKAIAQSRQEDVKGIYRENAGKSDIIGVDLKFDEPLNSDLVVNTGDESAEASFAKILGYLNAKYPEIFR